MAKQGNPDYQALLEWLNPVRAVAESLYVEILDRLVRFFAGRGADDPETLATRTIDRVAEKAPELLANSNGEHNGKRVPYFLKVANFVWLEHLRKEPARAALPAQLPDTEAPEWLAEVDEKFECLDLCLGRIRESKRRLIVEYYQRERKDKIDHHAEMAGRLHISLNALRIQVHRIRGVLRRCALDCVRRTRVLQAE